MTGSSDPFDSMLRVVRNADLLRNIPNPSNGMRVYVCDDDVVVEYDDTSPGQPWRQITSLRPDGHTSGEPA